MIFLIELTKLNLLLNAKVPTITLSFEGLLLAGFLQVIFKILWFFELTHPKELIFSRW